MNLQHRLVGQLVVLIPTLATSAVLGYEHVALVPRLIASLGVGLLLIAVVAYARRKSPLE
jgi:hypothetical protein